jgi:hypothetical protein
VAEYSSNRPLPRLSSISIPPAMGANEKVTLALIGGRNQGRGDAEANKLRRKEYRAGYELPKV